MDRERWRIIKDLFDAALMLPDVDTRRAFLQNSQPDDPQLVAEVMAMLEQDRVHNTLLDRGIGHVADAMFGTVQPSVGSRIGRYTIKGALGEGGMGVVCLAERPDLGSHVAIKILRDAWISPARRERFASEQRVLAQLNHPGIARLYDADTLDDGTPWFAMEYVDGLPLTDYCEKHRSTIARRLQLFRQACEAVQDAHSHAVIHRDIKPSNILVKIDGGVRLLDFGIAKQLDAIADSNQRTRTMLRPMTPAYAAPEQLLGDRIGVHTDVYSLGIVLYELLTGRLPFELANLSVAEATTVVTSHEPPRPSEFAAARADAAGSISNGEWADLNVLCMTAMHADPSRRYRSVEAMLRDVDHYLNSEALEARPDTWHYRASKFLRRHWQVASMATAAAVLLLGLSVYFTLRLASARDAALAEAERTDRVQQLMTRIFEGGDGAAGPAESLRVVDVLERGAREALAMSTDPGVRADLVYNLAGIYQNLGQLDKADSLYQAALGLRRELFGTRSSQVAECLTAIGELRIKQARLDEAEKLIRHSRAIALQSLPPRHPILVAASTSLGNVLRERGEHDKAIETLAQVVALRTSDDVPLMEQAAALSALADAHYSAGHYQQSEKLYHDALTLHRRELGGSHPLVASDLASLAAIQQDLGYYPEAERLSRQALMITETHYGKDSTHTADDLTSLGRALTYQKKYAEAVSTLERALAIQEVGRGSSHPAVAEVVNELGNVLAMHDRLDEAGNQFRRAAEIYRAVYGEQHYLRGIALSNVANIHLLQKDYARAEPLFRDAIRIFTKALSADNVNTGIARIKLGRTLLRAARYEEASLETLAGYEILARQTSPAVSFLRAARTDLVAAYDALNRTPEAQRFRDELAAMDPPEAAGKGK